MNGANKTLMNLKSLSKLNLDYEIFHLILPNMGLSDFWDDLSGFL